MDVLWFWLLVVVLLIAVFAWPTWPYTRQRGIYRRGGRWPYAPSLLAAILFVLVLLLFWLGFLGVWWPWAVGPSG